MEEDATRWLGARHRSGQEAISVTVAREVDNPDAFAVDHRPYAYAPSPVSTGTGSPG